MKYLFIFSVIWIWSSCKQQPKSISEPISHFETIDYVKVGQVFDSIQPPYIIDVSNGTKCLVFIGCEHQAGATHPQFSAIETYFKKLQPQISFNEGGQWTDSMRFKTVNDAIQKDGEVGALKFWSDSAGIKMMNGDLSAKEEFALTSRYHTQEEWYLYYMIERIAMPFLYDKNEKALFDSVFQNTTKGYFTQNGFKMSKEQLTVEHFKKVYKKYIGKPFDSQNFDIEAFDYVNDNCKFCAIGRTSKMVRDSVLLSKIDNALNQYDRVMVTFGHGHALAVEPALKQIINRKR